MQRIAIAKITKEECDEYALLYEKILAYRSLKEVIKNNKECVLLAGLEMNSEEEIKMLESEQQCNHDINSWWDKIDAKYILEYDDSKILILEFEDKTIYSVSKEDWHKSTV